MRNFPTDFDHTPSDFHSQNEVDTAKYPLKDADFVVGYDEEGKRLTAGALRRIEAMPNKLLRVDFPKIKDPSLGLVIDHKTRALEKLSPAEQQEYLIRNQTIRNKLYAELRNKYDVGIPKFWSWIGKQNLDEGKSRLGLFTLVEKIESQKLTDSIPEEAIPAIGDCYLKLAEYYFDKVKNKDWGPYLQDVKSVPAHFHYSQKDQKVYMVDIGIEGIAFEGKDWSDGLNALHMSGQIQCLIDSLQWLERNRFKKPVFADLEKRLKEMQQKIQQTADSWFRAPK